MDEIFGNIYDFLTWRLYSDALSRYLWGWDCGTGGFTESILYNHFGLITFFTTLLLVLVYYYLWCPVRHQRIWWSVLLLSNAFLQAIIGYAVLYDNNEKGLIGDCLLYNEDQQVVIDNTDFIWFGVTNAFLAVILFYLISWLIKWGSKTGKYYPFKYPF